ncbi:DUF433 domain-containing protein [Flavisolibacter sp. BT320]|jgi:uncharacterized protein (DUF433 family)|nr:DUF433 domain-containing protein [Flavisolibacter longurius]
MEWQQHIVTDENVLLGKPTIKGTRISIEHILSLFAQGWSEQMILENYPRLTKESIQAVFVYLNECMQDGLLFVPAKKSA